MEEGMGANRAKHHDTIECNPAIHNNNNKKNANDKEENIIRTRYGRVVHEPDTLIF